MWAPRCARRAWRDGRRSWMPRVGPACACAIWRRSRGTIPLTSSPAGLRPILPEGIRRASGARPGASVALVRSGWGRRCGARYVPMLVPRRRPSWGFAGIVYGHTPHRDRGLLRHAELERSASGCPESGFVGGARRRAAVRGRAAAHDPFDAPARCRDGARRVLDRGNGRRAGPARQDLRAGEHPRVSRTSGSRSLVGQCRRGEPLGERTARGHRGIRTAGTALVHLA